MFYVLDDRTQPVALLIHAVEILLIPPYALRQDREARWHVTGIVIGDENDPETLTGTSNGCSSPRYAACHVL